MKIHVTAAHIKAGFRNSAGSCPVALAIREAIGGTNAYAVGDVADIYNRDWPLPLKAQRFQEAYDAGKKVKPFTFEIKGLKKEKTKSARS